ncbi:MAG: IS1634 family transposase, partial [Bacteroidetes bacterium]|nr:IS1634 family transposase [Bacteroidota bacterium]
GLSDLLGIAEDDIYENRLYRALDELVVHKDDVQRYLKERLGELFEIKYDILLYDVTSTYFEGEAEANPQARRGYSRNSRPDCKSAFRRDLVEDGQVCIGLVVTREGIPLGYEVFEGNKHDSKTVDTIVKKPEALYGKSDRVWIMDRGMVSPDNLKLVGAEGRRYIIGTPKSQLWKFEQHFVDKEWQKVHEGLEVKLCPSPEGAEEIFILCRSAARKKKEEAMHNRFADQIREGLERVKKNCESRHVKTVNVAERRIGRLLQKNQRASSLFDINVKDHDGRVSIDWSVHDNETEWARISEGHYLLRTNIKNWTAEDLWKAYIQLTEAEESFRIQKHDLQLRPIWHQKEN